MENENKKLEDIKFFNRALKFIAVFITLITALCIRYALVFTPTSSMSPTIKTYRPYICEFSAFFKPERLDIVSFDPPIDSSGKLYLKRCVGMPGELLSIHEGSVYINGKLIDEPFIAEPYDSDYSEIYIPKKGDEVFIRDGICLIGERPVGKAPEFIDMYCTELDGRYIVEEDTYFMLGDNVNNSFDCRYFDNHFVREDMIKYRLLKEG